MKRTLTTTAAGAALLLALTGCAGGEKLPDLGSKESLQQMSANLVAGVDTAKITLGVTCGDQVKTGEDSKGASTVSVTCNDGEHVLVIVAGERPKQVAEDHDSQEAKDSFGSNYQVYSSGVVTFVGSPELINQIRM